MSDSGFAVKNDALQADEMLQKLRLQADEKVKFRPKIGSKTREKDAFAG